MAEILVVDDEIGIRELLSEILGDEGHSVLVAENAQQARQVREENRLDLVLLDIWMPDTDGVTLLREWASAGTLTMPVIMMSGHATIDTAVEATRIGAFDFLEKPITLQKLLEAVESGLERARALTTGITVAPTVAATPVPAAVAAPAGMSVAVLGAATADGSGIVTARIPVSGGIAPSAAPGMPGAAPAGHPGADIGAGQGSVPAAAPGSESVTDGASAATPGHVALHELPLELPLREARDRFERAYFEHHLIRERGSMTRVAERTGLERTHLYRKLKQLGIDLSRGAYRKQGTDSA